MDKESLRCWAGLISLVIVYTLGACSGSGELVETTYNTDRGVTTYEAAPISFTSSRMQSGLGRNRSLVLEARASCRGQACVPEEVALVFSTSSNSSIFLTDRSIVLDTGEETYEWNEPRDTDTFEGETVIGQITRINVTLEELQDIASAETVDCSIGGASFQLSFRDRGPLRQMVEVFESETVSG